MQLTDTRHEVRMVFMKEFYSQGWTHFATLGRVATSGWAVPNPALPHAFANHRVTRDLHAALYDKPWPATGESWPHLSPVRVTRAD
ncbi:MAG: hypothetical protein RQ826_17525 [Xanthomonadales bacterium]|nr:hypothetical protein [Xanthomonadales bacterium]